MNWFELDFLITSLYQAFPRQKLNSGLNKSIEKVGTIEND